MPYKRAVNAVILSVTSSPRLAAKTTLAPTVNSGVEPTTKTSNYLSAATPSVRRVVDVSPSSFRAKSTVTCGMYRHTHSDMIFWSCVISTRCRSATSEQIREIFGKFTPLDILICALFVVVRSKHRHRPVFVDIYYFDSRISPRAQCSRSRLAVSCGAERCPASRASSTPIQPIKTSEFMRQDAQSKGHSTSVFNDSNCYGCRRHNAVWLRMTQPT